MTLDQALASARRRLALSQPESDSALEAEVLLREVLGIDRVQLRLDSAHSLDPRQQEKFERLLERRLAGEPLAYILERREFFGLDFFVDRRVLIPRPESELLVEEALKVAKSDPGTRIADIGTGSGCLAVSLALKLPAARIIATDVSSAALEVARLNCQKHGVAGKVDFVQGDLLGALPSAVDLLIANLPYVRRRDLQTLPFTRFEPRLALDGGEEGLDLLFALIAGLPGKLNSEGVALLEVGLGQDLPVAQRLRETFPGAGIKSCRDLAGIERVVILSLGGSRRG